MVNVFDDDSPWFTPNPGQNQNAISSAEVAAYGTAASKPAGDRTAAETALVAGVEAKAGQVSQGWNATQQQVAAEVLARAAELQAEMQATIRQYAKTGRSNSLSEMFSVLTKAMAKRDREILEALARLDGSPY